MPVVCEPGYRTLNIHNMSRSFFLCAVEICACYLELEKKICERAQASRSSCPLSGDGVELFNASFRSVHHSIPSPSGCVQRLPRAAKRHKKRDKRMSSPAQPGQTGSSML